LTVIVLYHDFTHAALPLRIISAKVAADSAKRKIPDGEALWGIFLNVHGAYSPTLICLIAAMPLCRQKNPSRQAGQLPKKGK